MNGTLAVFGGIGEGDAWCEVKLLRSPEVRLAIWRAGRTERDIRIVPSAGRSSGYAVGKESIERDGRSNLLTVFLVGHAEIDIAQSKGQRKLRSCLPLILKVILLLEVMKGVRWNHACTLGHKLVVLYLELSSGLRSLDGAHIGDDRLVIEVRERR